MIVQITKLRTSNRHKNRFIFIVESTVRASHGKWAFAVSDISTVCYWRDSVNCGIIGNLIINIPVVAQGVKLRWLNTH